MHQVQRHTRLVAAGRGDSWSHSVPGVFSTVLSGGLQETMYRKILSELRTPCKCELLEPGGVRSGGYLLPGVRISVYITLFIPGTPDPCEYYPEKYHLNMHINKQVWQMQAPTMMTMMKVLNKNNILTCQLSRMVPLQSQASEGKNNSQHECFPSVLTG